MNQVKKIFLIAAAIATFASIAAAQDQIQWVTDLAQARRLAQQQQRLVLLHFWSDECPPCRALEQNVFNQPELIRVISTNFIPVKINALQQSRYADYYHIERVPTDIVVLPNGKEIHRSTSPPRMNDYIAMLDQVRSKSMTDFGLYPDMIANHSTPSVDSQLPPMPSADPNEQATSQSINGDPRGVFEESNTKSVSNRSPWQSSQPTDTAPPQRAVVQNQYTIPNTATVPSTPEASNASRTGNPYVNTESPPPPTQNETTAPAPQNSQANVDAGVAPADAPANNSQNSSAPPEAPPVSLDGYCPVTLVVMSKWTKGDPRFGAIHRGRTYLMASQAELDRFLTDPDRYSPALSGFDPVRFAETRQLVNGKREWGVYYDKSFYLFADETALKRFEAQPARYVNAVRQAMAAGRPTTPQR